jgi:uncharacterized membrane protein (DUF106 family)
MVQEELFGASKIQDLKRKVQELDSKIIRAMKKRDFPKAKTLTDQQSELLKELLDLGEASPK